MEDTNMMLDWNEYRKQLSAGVKQVGQISPDTIKGYIELSSPGSKKNLLGPLMRSGIIRACVALHMRRLIPRMRSNVRSIDSGPESRV
jgi:hypothetical protein